MSGTFDSSVAPSTSNAAAISFSTEFFAPGTTTAPASGPDARTTIASSAVAATGGTGGSGSTADQYAPRVPDRGRTVTRVWPDEPAVRASLERPRDDLVLESPLDGSADARTFAQADGPFLRYERELRASGEHLTERTTYRLSIPWFGWLFALPVRALVGRRWHQPHGGRPHRNPWWAPPDRLDQRQVAVIGLLAAASMSSAFINTLFTQTVNFAADDFGVGNAGVGVAGAIVRAGIVLALPFALLADRIGRRRVVSVVAWAAPLVTALGAFAPSFPFLVATQAVGRPLGLALDFLIAVVAAEEMPRNSRAYAVSVLAMASGLGAGLAVAALPLADLGESSWRYIYLVTLVWLAVAVSVSRQLPETRRFERPHVVAPPLDRRRFGILALVAAAGNVYIAPASFFQNSYLEDARGYSAAAISAITFTTATPAAIGLIIGGRTADVRGRRRLLAVTIPVATTMSVLSFSVAGAPMWVAAFLAGFVGSIAYPALAVYRAELFPTGNRGRAAGFLTAAALLGGIVGLLVAGVLLDGDWPHGRVMALLALGQVVVVVTVLRTFPETAHRTLEELNPQDAPPALPAP
jgi:MFS family permease